MITWSWRVVTFILGLVIGAGVIIVPMMSKAMKKFGEKK